MKNAELLDYAKSMVKDQKDWLDAHMYKLLPQKFHYQIRQGHINGRHIQEWLLQNQIEINFFRNVPMIRIMVRGKLYAEYKIQLNVDGRPVETGKLVDPKFAPEDIWVDGEQPKS